MIEESKILKFNKDYIVYNTGKIYSLKTHKYLKVNHDTSGYQQVILYNGKNRNNRKTYKVHRLVAMMFIDNPTNKQEINHIDCNKDNNCVTNLEWCDRRENIAHAIKNNRCIRTSISPLTKEQVLLIKDLIEYGSSLNLIAKLYKVSLHTIRFIVNRRTWKSLNINFPKNINKHSKENPSIPTVLYDKLLTFNIDNTVLISRFKRLETV